MSKNQSDLLGSRLQSWNLLETDTNVTVYRNRDIEFIQYFALDNDLTYCSDVDGLMSSYGHEHKSAEWRLFIDSSQKSLKAVLLHNGNQFLSVPIGYSALVKETYETMKKLLELIKYEQYKWPICSNL